MTCMSCKDYPNCGLAKATLSGCTLWRPKDICNNCNHYNRKEEQCRYGGELTPVCLCFKPRNGICD